MVDGWKMCYFRVRPEIGITWWLKYFVPRAGRKCGFFARDPVSSA